MILPCSHNHHRFTTTSDTPLPFDENGVIHWYAYTSDHIDYHEQMGVFNKAFDEWNKHFAPLRFVYTDDPNKAYIKIKFSGLRLSIFAELITSIFPYFKKYFTVEPFPMEDNTLAYAFGAGSGKYEGHLYINSKYDWVHGDYSLYKVILHELGHNQNIGHTDHQDDIMYEVYKPNAEITQDSINAVNHIYANLKNNYKHVATSQPTA